MITPANTVAAPPPNTALLAAFGDDGVLSAEGCSAGAPPKPAGDGDGGEPAPVPAGDGDGDGEVADAAGDGVGGVVVGAGAGAGVDVGGDGVTGAGVGTRAGVAAGDIFGAGVGDCAVEQAMKKAKKRKIVKYEAIFFGLTKPKGFRRGGDSGGGCRKLPAEVLSLERIGGKVEVEEVRARSVHGPSNFLFMVSPPVYRICRFEDDKR
ncbi:hypothetical protein FXO37_34983 [Capsicum annuum]|nr:hypothetical protein FXO37_34983 [Capsicum annuum]